MSAEIDQIMELLPRVARTDPRGTVELLDLFICLQRAARARGGKTPRLAPLVHVLKLAEFRVQKRRGAASLVHGLVIRDAL